MMVDVTGTSKGKGTAGTIKRHNQSRGPETHGSKYTEALALWVLHPILLAYQRHEHGWPHGSRNSNGSKS